MSKRETVAIILALLVVGVVARLLPHMPNFAPITATALFSGVYLSKRMSLLVPAAVMLTSDYLLLYINPYGSTSFDHFYSPLLAFHSSLPYVYASFGISALVGWLLRREHSPVLVVAAAMFCSVQFFLITNAAVWIEGAYARGLDGLWQSYVAGLPFYRGTLAGDVFYAIVFFGAWKLVKAGRVLTSPKQTSVEALRSG